MKYEKEISKDGQNWQKVVLYSALPIHPKARYILAIKNLILFGFRDVKKARRQLWSLKDELDKVGIVMALAGLEIKLYAMRDIIRPAHERGAIDAEFEEVE